MKNNKYRICNKVNDKLLKEMIEIDKEAYQGEDVGDFKRIKKWLEANDEIYTILTLDKKVIGYICLLAITEETYNKFRNGNMKDFELEKSDLRKFDNANRFLIASLVLEKTHQSGQALLRLLFAFKNKIEKLKRRGADFSNIIMDCVSEQGEKSAKNLLNAKFVTNSKGGKIYEGEI